MEESIKIESTFTPFGRNKQALEITEEDEKLLATIVESGPIKVRTVNDNRDEDNY